MGISVEFSAPAQCGGTEKKILETLGKVPSKWKFNNDELWHSAL